LFYKLENIKIILAGKKNKYISKLLKNKKYEKLTNSNLIESRLFFHSKLDEARLFSEIDYVWLGYTNEFCGSSGILYQAWSIKKPVLGSNHGLIAEEIKKYKLGHIFDIDRPEEIFNTLSYLIKAREKKGLEIDYNFTNFDKDKHSPSNFAKEIISIYEENS